jgi:hypothetical protein
VIAEQKSSAALSLSQKCFPHFPGAANELSVSAATAVLAS